MNRSQGERPRRRRIVPEVIQTSAMDCGPAALKAVLEGFGRSASYGRLREACQTEVDGTSIDTLEELAGLLGLEAEQIMVPADHLLEPDAETLPALLVTLLPSGVTHFVVVWSCRCGLVQLMDPAAGRRWVRPETLLSQTYVHELEVAADSWREWAGTDDFLRPLAARLRRLGVGADSAREMVRAAGDSGEWRPLALLDAAVRMVKSLVDSGAIRRGTEAERLVRRAVARAPQPDAEAEMTVPGVYWSVRDARAEDGEEAGLRLRGAVLIRFRGLAPAGDEDEVLPDGAAELPPSLAAVLEEAPARPGMMLLRTLRRDGLLRPLTTLAGLGAAAVGVVVQALLFRGLIDLGRDLGLPGQRAAAVGALIAVLTGVALLEAGVAASVLGLGRRLEARLRMAFLSKIPRLGDRYFHSRLTSDMAERTHTVHRLRNLPTYAARLVRSASTLVCLTAGIAWLDPRSAPFAILAAVLSVSLPVLSQSFVAERDWRVRTHGGALMRFYLDSLLGLMPIRCHGAEPAVGREHESLLTRWAKARLSLVRATVVVDGLVTAAGLGLAVWLVAAHVGRAGDSAMVLLLVYWALELPAVGTELALAVRQYPSQRNTTLRLLEPLGAPEEVQGASGLDAAAEAEGGQTGVAIEMRAVSVRLSGRPILHDVVFRVEAGSHVAVIGPSGAGKSTLLGVLLGWHPPAHGSVEIDGAQLSGERLAALRRETAWVDPTVELWNRSVMANLRFGCEDEPTLGLSALMARTGLHDLLQRLPEGLQTSLGEGGGLLSGGEGQRVRLARAMLRSGVRLALLDEPFRGLDREVRRRLMVEARELWRRATLLCVTHDVGETLLFDRVLVLDRGRVVADGPPRELARASEGPYRQLLDAERAVRTRLWERADWRRLHLEQGTLREEVGRP